MASKQHWFATLINGLSSFPLVSNVVFSLILVGLEKLVEVEFACPCNPRWNRVFSAAFFIIPAIMTFTMMLIIQGCKCDDKRDLSCCITVSLSSFVPAYVWLMLLFFDGQYFACAKTDWEGRYVLVDNAAPRKWCKPPSAGDDTSQELLRSQEWFVQSQGIGIILLIVICVGLGVYAVIECYKKQVATQNAGNNNQGGNGEGNQGRGEVQNAGNNNQGENGEGNQGGGEIQNAGNNNQGGNGEGNQKEMEMQDYDPTVHGETSPLTRTS